MFPVYILLAGGIALTIGDLIAGKYIKNKTKMLYLSVMIFYIIALICLTFSYKFENIAVASITLEIFNILTLTIAGKFLFKENITKTELCGILVGLLAVIIL